MPAILVQVLLWAGSSLVRNFFLSVGVGLASFAFLLPLVSGLIDTIIDNFDNVAVEVLQILEIAGLSPAMSMLLGALITSATMSAMRKTMISRGSNPRTLGEML